MSHGPQVVLLAGLPASGKTTTATRLQARAGGVLIRSCDVFQDLGIDLPAWVRRTAGFRHEVRTYEALRDRAYVEMARRLATALGDGASLVIVDAVHGEPAKRAVLYALCAARGVVPAVLWCRCDDHGETARRFAARQGRAAAPENEASDVSVYRHIAGLWTDPTGDRLPDATPVPLVIYDTVTQALRVPGADGPAVALVLDALAS